jgi:hypothetical protein
MASGDWTGDRFIPANFGCWDGHPYRRSKIHEITIHQSQEVVVTQAIRPGVFQDAIA